MKVLIFKPGEWNGTKYSRAFAVELAERYKGSRRQSPVVVGHRWDRKSDADELAHGWVASLEANGVGNVYAEITDVSDELLDWVETKQLRYVSAEFKMCWNDKDEPITPDLIAIAMLGRSRPAVEGTKVVSLRADGTKDNKAEVVSFSIEIEQFESQKEEDMAEETTKTVDTAVVQKLEATIAKKDKELVALQERERTRESTVFADTLVTAGKVLPVQKEQVQKLHSTLEGEQRTAFASLLEGLIPQVSLGSAHVATGPTEDGVSVVDKVKAYQAKHKIASFADAYVALAAEDASIVVLQEKEA